MPIQIYRIKAGKVIVCDANNIVAPLHYAAQLGHVDLLALLLQRNAQANIKDKNNNVILMRV